MKRIYLFLAILSLMAPAAGLNWTGAVSTAWHEPGNWSPATVPDASFGVTVPVVASGRYPLVSTTEAHCYSLVINSGASVTVGANDLNVALNASIFGTLNIISASEFWVGSGIVWQSGSTASITHSLAEIRCQSMAFLPESNVQFALGTVIFESSGLGCSINNLSPTTEFNNIRSSCEASAFLTILNAVSAADFAINGWLRNDALSHTSCSYTGNIILKGDLIDYNLAASPRGICFGAGTLIMDGTTQNISFGSDACYLNNLVCGQSGNLYLTGDLTLKGGLNIESGVFDPQGNDIFLAGDWQNTAGTPAFVQAGTTVEFNGNGNSTVFADENFDSVRLNKGLAAAGLTVPTGGAIVCDSYDWSQGFLTVAGGLFYAHDLADPGITGTVTLTSGNMLLVQDEAQYLDLLGDLTVSGGELHLYGGSPGYTSFFPFNVPGSLTMSAGLLYRHVEGITIPLTSSGVLTSNISGGIIRVGGDFECFQAFSPSGGMLEMKESADAYLEMTEGTLNNLFIDKAPATRTEDDFPPTLIRRDRDGASREVARSGRVSLSDDLEPGGYVDVYSGTLDLNGHSLTTDHDLDVWGTLSVDAGSILVLGNSTHLNIHADGRLEVLGTDALQAGITHDFTGYYYLNVLSGASIAASNAIFQYLNTNGVNVQNGATVDPAHAFTACTFRYGVSGGDLLTINTNQELWIVNASFPTNAGGSANNVKKTLNQGNVHLVNASGAFAGEAFDDDFYDRVHWSAATAEPDLMVLSAAWSPASNPYLGDTRTLTVKVFNNSTADCTTNAWLDLYYDLASPPAVDQLGDRYKWVQDTFPAFGTVTVTFEVSNFNEALAGTWNSWLQIDSLGDIAESDETNNVFGPLQITWQALPAVANLALEPDPALPGNVKLSWSYPLSVTRFRIYRDLDPYGSFTALAGTTTANTFSQAAGARYFYRVTAQRVEPARSENPPRP